LIPITRIKESTAEFEATLNPLSLRLSPAGVRGLGLHESDPAEASRPERIFTAEVN